MKRFLSFLMITAMIASLLLGVFACKETPEELPPVDVDSLAAEVVTAALPNGEDNEAIKTDLLRYMTKAEVEKADVVAILFAFKEHADEIGALLTALHTEEFDDTAKGEIADALALVATAVSADVAGDLYYAVASDLESDLPYTLSDCRKVATLYFTFYREIEGYSFTDLMKGDLKGLGEREINTLLVSLASSLRAVKGLSADSKAYLMEKALLLSDGIEGTSGISQEDATALKTYIDRFVTLFFDGYEPFVSYGAAFAANASAETFLGATYAREETTVNYGYDYDTWEMTVLTEKEYESYLATKEGYDTAFPVEEMAEGYYENGTFHALSKSDIALAKKAGLLRVVHAAYAALSDEEKDAFKTHTEALLSFAAEDEAMTAALFGVRLSETPSNESTISFDELKTVLSALADFDSRSGITDEERTAATAAVNAFSDYMRGYFPHLF